MAEKEEKPTEERRKEMLAITLRVEALERGMKENTTLTQNLSNRLDIGLVTVDNIKKDTKELVEIFKNAKGAARVFIWIGSFIKWGGGIFIAVGVIVTAINAIAHGKWPW